MQTQRKRVNALERALIRAFVLSQERQRERAREIGSEKFSCPGQQYFPPVKTIQTTQSVRFSLRERVMLTVCACVLLCAKSLYRLRSVWSFVSTRAHARVGKSMNASTSTRPPPQLLLLPPIENERTARHGLAQNERAGFLDLVLSEIPSCDE